MKFSGFSTQFITAWIIASLDFISAVQYTFFYIEERPSLELKPNDLLYLRREAENVRKIFLNLHHSVSPDDFDGAEVILERL